MRLTTRFRAMNEEAGALRDPLVRATFIEQRFHEAVVDEAGCRADRFVAYLQPYELEALLFSDVDRLVEVEPRWGAFAERLRQVRAAAVSPEHIDDGAETLEVLKDKDGMRP